MRPYLTVPSRLGPSTRRVPSGGPRLRKKSTVYLTIFHRIHRNKQFQLGGGNVTPEKMSHLGLSYECNRTETSSAAETDNESSGNQSSIATFPVGYHDRSIHQFAGGPSPMW